MTNQSGGEASIGHGSDLEHGASTAAGEPTIRDCCLAMLEAGFRVVVDLFDRIFHGIQWIAPVVLGIGCQSTNEPAAVEPPPTATEPAPRETAPETEPRQLGKFTITFYYVVGEEELLAKAKAKAANENRTSDNDNRTSANENRTSDNDNRTSDNDNRTAGTESSGSGDGSAELTAIDPTGGSAPRPAGRAVGVPTLRDLASPIVPDVVTLYTENRGQCEPIAEVSKEFATQLTLQGTGKLRDGRIVNIWGACRCERTPCFKVTQAQWGTAGTGRPLMPFRTIAVDPKVVKLGSLLYLPLLEGRTMPGRPPWGGFVHDGCVVADDTGGHILGNRIDLFVGRRAYYLGMSGSGGRHAWARNVPVFDGASVCERKGRRVGRKAGSI
jgi:3D (Asp-Asp-Asp) domain-containing protein